jgi:protein CLEC16A
VQAALAPPSFPLSSVWQGSKRGREEQEEVHKSSEAQEEVHKSSDKQEEVHKSSEEQEEVQKSSEEQKEVHKSSEEQKEVHKSREEQEELHKSREEQEEDYRLALSLSQAESSTSPVRQIKNIDSNGRTSPPKKQGSSRSALFGSPGAVEEELELAARKQEELAARKQEELADREQLEMAARTQEELAMALALSKVGGGHNTVDFIWETVSQS